LPNRRPIAQKKAKAPEPKHRRVVPVEVLDSYLQDGERWFAVKLQGKRIDVRALQGFIEREWILGDLLHVQIDRLTGSRQLVIVSVRPKKEAT